MDSAGTDDPPSLFRAYGPPRGHFVSSATFCRCYTRHGRPIYGVVGDDGRVDQWMDDGELMALRRAMRRPDEWLANPDGTLGWLHGPFVLLGPEQPCLCLATPRPRVLMPVAYVRRVLRRLAKASAGNMPPGADFTVVCSSADGRAPSEVLAQEEGVGWIYRWLSQ